MKRVLWALLGLGAGLGLGWWLLSQPPRKNPRFEPTAEDLKIPYISARGAFLDGVETPNFQAIAVGDIPGLSTSAPCADDVLIVIHGFNNQREKAMNRFGVARQSLLRAGYPGIVVGFSWDADTQHDPFSMTGYHQGRTQAVASGAILARSIRSMKRNCPKMRIRMIGYSMGARVALETLLALGPGPLVDSVHLVGAAMDNEEPEVGERYGAAIESGAKHVVNYFSPEDSKLGLFFWAKEGDRALGKHDLDHPARRPRNYLARNMAKELPEIDSDGNVVPDGALGKNHSGYLGTRNGEGKLTDDGVMDVIARDIGQFK